jgi:ribosomal protein S18 acetylase RimI-like enzyme
MKKCEPFHTSLKLNPTCPENSAKIEKILQQEEVMSSNARPVLVAKITLSLEEVGEVQTLAALCNQLEGLDLKLPFPLSQSTEPSAFLCYADGRLVGYSALDGDEVCGMVHPDRRRQGIGRKLLTAALEEAGRRRKPHLLLICEASSSSGQAFVAAQKGQHAFGEYRMVLETLRETPPNDLPIQLQEAGPEDVERLTEILAESFGDPEEIARENVVESMALHNDQFYLALSDGAPVGALKVVYEPPRAGIYAFGVLPSRQGRGIGRQILFQMCARLLAQGHQPISLEVETDNNRAISVYRACGFRETTVYNYYQVSGAKAGR